MRQAQSGDDLRALNLIGANVLRLRKTFGWSQRELARRSRVSFARISRLEGGQHEPSILVLYRIGLAFGCGLRGLLEGVE